MSRFLNQVLSPLFQPGWLTRPRLYAGAAAHVFTLATAAPAAAQSDPALGCQGWARCQVDVRGPGYADQQTHTWTLTGGPPSIEGAFRVYPATWSVVGGGAFQRSQGAQTLNGEWATNGSPMSAPIAVFVRASSAPAAASR